MKEIIYLQAGETSNYIGTHFFNTLEAYFSYKEDDTRHSDVAHDVSFREGLAPNGDSTFCPRLLLFDYKNNFGALPKISELYAPESDSVEIAWNGNIDANRQLPLEKSEYQASLEKEFQEEHDAENDALNPVPPSSIRFWSDFNRVYHIPRSLHPLPTPMAPRDENGGNTDFWENGKDEFKREDSDHDVLDEDFRLFLEECDLLQGIQTTFDNRAFGSFTTTMLEGIRDEVPKISSLTFINLEAPSSHILDYLDSNTCRRVVNEALTLQKLDELSSLTIPLQSSKTWHSGPWSSSLEAEFDSLWHSSAILSSQIESVTLPFRLQSSERSIADLCAQLNWRGNMRFAQLEGMFPLVSSTDPSYDVNSAAYDFSTGLDRTFVPRTNTKYARWDVVRGLLDDERLLFDARLGDTTLRQPFYTRLWTPIAYPLPTSFPQFFKMSKLTPTGRRTDGHGATSRITSLPIRSMLSSTSSLAHMFRAQENFIGTFLSKGGDVNVLGPGIGREELKELKEDLIRLGDAFAGQEEYDYQEEDDGVGDDFGDD